MLDVKALHRVTPPDKGKPTKRSTLFGSDIDLVLKVDSHIDFRTVRLLYGGYFHG